jgi:uncharacterized protein YxeA
MKQINILLLFIILILLISILYCKKENFGGDSTFDNNISDIEKKIKALEFAMMGMKNNTNVSLNAINEKRPYKTVYNYY